MKEYIALFLLFLPFCSFIGDTPEKLAGIQDASNFRIMCSSNRKSKEHCDFSYTGNTGPEYWPFICKTCGGNNQSPININMARVRNKTLRVPLRWNKLYRRTPEKISIFTDGHTIKLYPYFYNDSHARISGGPLKNNYRLQNIHFHWADTDRNGSEHTINKGYRAMEMHLVHEKECLTKDKGGGTKYLVAAFLFTVGDEGPVAFNYITAEIRNALKHPNKKFKLKHNFSLNSLFPLFVWDYVYYLGSLTTPPCLEEVTWLVNLYNQPISLKQMREFREACKILPKLRNNFRPTQKINNRKIYLISKSKRSKF